MPFAYDLDWLAGVTIFAIGTILTLSIILGTIMGNRSRRLKLATRPKLKYDSWYSRYYSDLGPQSSQAVEQVLRIFSDAVHIDATQLHPSDRVYEDYVSNGVWRLFDDSQEVWANDLYAYIIGVSGKEVAKCASEAASDWTTLDDFIRGILALVSQQHNLRRRGNDDLALPFSTSPENTGK